LRKLLELLRAGLRIGALRVHRLRNAGLHEQEADRGTQDLRFHRPSGHDNHIQEYEVNGLVRTRAFSSAPLSGARPLRRLS
jgi:hypothetical protein